jgi:hypothetical protein
MHKKSCKIVVYVDDLIVSGPSFEQVTEPKNIIKGFFVCRIAGPMKEYLGVLFELRDDGTFVLGQRQYLLNILQLVGMKDCEPCSTPCVPKKMTDAEYTDTLDITFPFREVASSLLYLSTHTRPDISFKLS